MQEGVTKDWGNGRSSGVDYGTINSDSVTLCGMPLLGLVNESDLSYLFAVSKSFYS